MTYNPAQSYLECGAYKFSFHSSNVFPGTFETVFGWWVIEISFIPLAKEKIIFKIIDLQSSILIPEFEKEILYERASKKKIFLNVQAAFYQLQYPISPICNPKWNFLRTNRMHFSINKIPQKQSLFTQKKKTPQNSHCYS